MKIKRQLAILLSVIIMVCVAPFTALAADDVHMGYVPLNEFQVEEGVEGVHYITINFLNKDKKPVVDPLIYTAEDGESLDIAEEFAEDMKEMGYICDNADDGKLEDITEDMTVDLMYSKLHTVTIRFLDADTGNEILDTVKELVKDGEIFDYSHTAVQVAPENWKLINEEVAHIDSVTEDTEMTLQYRIDQKTMYTVTAYFVDENGENLARPVEKQIAGGDIFEIVNPQIDGYMTASDKTIISNVTSDQSVNVVYQAAQYKVKINFIDENKKKLADSYEETVGYNGKVEIENPTFEGYKTDSAKTVLENISSDKEVNVIYNKIKYTVKINYVDENKKSVAKSHEEKVAYNGSLEIKNPVIKGYTTDKEKTVVKNVKENKNINVVYKQKKITVTVKFVDEQGNKIADSKEVAVAYGGTFSMDSPAFAGYAAKDTKVVIEDVTESREITIAYKKVGYIVKIKFVDEDGNELAEAKTVSANYGEDVKVEVPEIEGYKADKNIIEIKGLQKDEEVTVTYTKTEESKKDNAQQDDEQKEIQKDDNFLLKIIDGLVVVLAGLGIAIAIKKRR